MSRRPPLSPMDTSQFAFPPDRQIHTLPRRALQTKRRPTPCESRQSTKEPPCKVRRIEYRQPRGEKDTFRSYREPTRIPSDTTTTTNDGWGSSDDDASTDRTLTEIERELGNDRDSSPTVTEQEEGDQVDEDLGSPTLSSPCPSKPSGPPQMIYSFPSDGRGEKRRRKVEPFRGQKRRKSEVSSDEETDTSDDEVFAGWEKELKVKSPKITTVYVPSGPVTAPPQRHSAALGPSESIADLARRIRCLQAAGSDIVMATDSEGEEDEARVSAALYSLPGWQSDEIPCALPLLPASTNGHSAQPSVLRLALIKRRELKARKKAPIWARVSASDPNRAFWAKYMYATSFARTRSRVDEYDDKLPGQKSNRYIRKVVTPESHAVPRPGPPKGWAPNALCLGQINIFLIRETVAIKRYRRDLKLAANARVEAYLPLGIWYQKVAAWWEPKPVAIPVTRPEEDEEAVEEGLLPPVEVGKVDLQAAEAMYTRRQPERSEQSDDNEALEAHEISDEVEDVDDQEEVDHAARLAPKRARSESVEPRETAEDRNRRINEDVALEIEQRAARYAQLEARQERESSEVAVMAPVPMRIISTSQWSAQPTTGPTSSGNGHVLGGVQVELPSSSASSDQDELESILAPASEPHSESVSSASSDTSSGRSDPPNYDDLHPLPISLPIPAAVLATLPRRQVLARPPPYQARLPLRGSAYDTTRTPSPPPPFNAQTDALTLIPPSFVPFFLESDDEDDLPAEELPAYPRHGGLGARWFPGRHAVEAMDREEREEREREQRIVGSFPRAASPPTPTPRARRQPRPLPLAQAPAQPRSRLEAQVQVRVSRRQPARVAREEVRARLTEHALRQHTRALQSIPIESDSFDTARDMESANDLEDELDEVDQEEEGEGLVGGLRRWVGRFWG